MKHSDAAQLLARAAAFDNRTASHTQTQAWAEAIPDRYTLDECIAAIVRHYARTTAYLEPAHINELVPIIRRDQQAENARRFGLPRPPIPSPETTARRLAEAKAALHKNHPTS